MGNSITIDDYSGQRPQAHRAEDECVYFDLVDYPDQDRRGWYYPVASGRDHAQETRELAAIKIQRAWRMWRAIRIAQRTTTWRALRKTLPESIMKREIWPFI